MTTQRLTAAAALHLGIPMTETIDQKVARLIALKAEAYYLQGRGQVEHALLAHAEFEASLRSELAPAAQPVQLIVGEVTDAEVDAAFQGTGWLGRKETLRYVLARFLSGRVATSTKPAPPLQDAKDALQQAEIGLANLGSYQSAGRSPSIHEYGQASRALIAVRAAIASQKGQL